MGWIKWLKPNLGSSHLNLHENLYKPLKKGLELHSSSHIFLNSKERNSSHSLERKKSPYFSPAKTHKGKDQVKDCWVDEFYGDHYDFKVFMKQKLI